MPLAGWRRVPNVLRPVSVAEFHALRVRVPAVRPTDFTHDWYDHAPLPFADPGVVLGGLAGRDPYARDQRAAAPAATWNRRVSECLALAAPSSQGNGD